MDTVKEGHQKLGVGQASSKLDGVPFCSVLLSHPPNLSATSSMSVCFIHLTCLVSNSQTFSHSKSAPLC